MTCNALLRWNATIWYRTESGLIDVAHAFEELDELFGLVEAGPDWNTIAKIEIDLARQSEPGLTLEASRER